MISNNNNKDNNKDNNENNKDNNKNNNKDKKRVLPFLSNLFDFDELIKRAIKYLIQGFFVAIAAFVIPKQSLDFQEIATISLVAAATFAILDTYLPSIGTAARTGAGFGIGANLVGFPVGL